MAEDQTLEEDQDESVDSAEKADDGVKCDNHPDRDATEYGGESFLIRLCDECAPPWFKDE